jgi:hypothetical protein
MKSLIDRPHTNHIKNFDRMTVELSKYMNEFEMDRCISFMDTLKDTKWDINPSVDDCKTQLEIILGKDRFNEIVMNWNKDNQKILTVFGTKKYKHKQDKTIWDGLDDTDNPDDYEVIYV